MAEMSITNEKSIVMRINAGGATYYICNRHNGITLDSEDYKPYLIGLGDLTKYGNFGGDNQIGTVSAKIMNGEEYHQGPYIYDITQTWNNRHCQIKLCDVGTDTTWDACEWYHKGIIKNFTIDNNNISFSVQDSDYRDFQTLPKYTVSEWAANANVNDSDIPDKFKTKTLPIQIGDLSDKNNGIFGKGVTISKKIGSQKIYFDSKPLYEMEDIGVWENGINKFFTAKKQQLVNGYEDGEYRIISDYLIDFNVSSGTTLDGSLSASSGIQSITVKDYKALRWLDESTYEGANNIEEVLSANIISVDSELMLLVDKPTTNTIWVERGYAGTTPESHGSTAVIRQSDKFSSKNLLTFTERFECTSVANFYYNLTGATTDPSDANIVNGWSNLIDGDNDTYIQITNDVIYPPASDLNGLKINADLKFNKVENDITVYNASVGIKADFTLTNSLDYFGLRIADSDMADTYNKNFSTVIAPRVFGYFSTGGSGAGTYSINTYDSIQRYNDYSTESSSGIQRAPVLMFEPDVDNNLVEINIPLYITKLTDLNNKYKMMLHLNPYSSTVSCKLYSIGIWLDMFIDFSRRVIMAPLKGRTTNYVHNAVIGSSIGNLIENPIDAIITLAEEIGYSSADDYDTVKFQSVRSYFENALTPSSKIATSYGIEDKENGFKLLQEMGNSFNFAVLKNYEGKITLANLHQLQNTDSNYGYNTLNKYAISLDDIILSPNNRMLNLQQTGTDRLSNNIEIRYNRNNSTDEYKSIYPDADDTVDSYTLKESGKTLEQVRNIYNNGKKTSLMIIESPFIYNADDAQRLWEWHINDKAEVHFWIEFTIDYNHYTNVNSKSSQYEIGDVIYLDGVYAAVTFNSDRLFYIVDIIKKDQGREIEIHAKSIEPIDQFTSSAIGQNETWQNTVTSSTIYQNDPTESTNIYQNKI